MRLAKASALINTTWQRLIRVAWVPSNQSIVTKPPLSITIPSQWSSVLPEPDCSPSIWHECFIFGAKSSKLNLISQNNINRISYWALSTLSPLIIGEQARVTAARAAGFPGKKGRAINKCSPLTCLYQWRRNFGIFIWRLNSWWTVYGQSALCHLKSEQCTSNIDMAHSIFNM